MNPSIVFLIDCNKSSGSAFRNTSIRAYFDSSDCLSSTDKDTFSLSSSFFHVSQMAFAGSIASVREINLSTRDTYVWFFGSKDCYSITECFPLHLSTVPVICTPSLFPPGLMYRKVHWENVYRKIIGIYRNFDAKLLNSFFANVSEVFWELIAPNLLILLLFIQNLKY